MHWNSLLLFSKYALPLISEMGNVRVLEVGPDKFPSSFNDLLNNFLKKEVSWDTVDLHSDPRLTYKSVSELDTGIASQQYDIVVAAQVIEHVRDPFQFVRELKRLLKKGGLLVIIAPCSWPYHEAPIDCWRIYADGIKAIFDYSSMQTLVAVSESLETVEGAKTYIPGRSITANPHLRDHLEGGFPIERAYDTIGICRKGVSAEMLR